MKTNNLDPILDLKLVIVQVGILLLKLPYFEVVKEYVITRTKGVYQLSGQSANRKGVKF